eukprot:comp104524_c0_seq1/m.48769 comp104524_c0_seq1/g.48769  ORF comp104524_c0_seq1/g.48769 comp104524_c0_seq1/m.48769 type:complete len:221 (-) comp104524_c0_seq1:170-832(-)
MDFSSYWLQALFLIFASLGVFLFFRLAYIWGHPLRTKQRTAACNTMVVLGSGGHTTEMLRMLEGVSPQRYAPRTYVLAETDQMSEVKARHLEAKLNPAGDQYTFRRIPRSREVGQSYVTSVLTTLRSQLSCLPLMLRLRPDLVMVNGPGTCVPICVLAILFRALYIKPCRVLYVESVARVETLSLTGRILYHARLADDFIVQWPQLVEKYPRAVYLGRLV